MRSPPAISSSRIKRGMACRLTPMQRTMFWWLNLLRGTWTQALTATGPEAGVRPLSRRTYLMMRASMRKSSSSCSEQTSGRVCCRYRNVNGCKWDVQYPYVVYLTFLHA